MLDVLSHLFLSFNSQLAWSREGLAAGELWRLLTPVLVHASPEHLMANLAQWLGIAWFARWGWKRWAAQVLFLSLATHAALLGTSLGLYVGASGVGYGLLVLAGFSVSRKVGTLFCLGLSAYLLAAPCLPSYWSFPVAHVAHWAGVASALAWLGLERALKTR